MSTLGGLKIPVSDPTSSHEFLKTEMHVASPMSNWPLMPRTLCKFDRCIAKVKVKMTTKETANLNKYGRERNNGDDIKLRCLLPSPNAKGFEDTSR